MDSKINLFKDKIDLLVKITVDEIIDKVKTYQKNI